MWRMREMLSEYNIDELFVKDICIKGDTKNISLIVKMNII